jgi:alpha-beta hydrolase superfamily lysophospholipase
VERENMGMLEIGSGLDLGEEALGPDHGGQLRSHDLDRDPAVVAKVVRQPDRGHTTRAQLPLDPIAVTERSRETAL